MNCLHQIWIQGYEKMPDKYKRQCEVWRRKNPDCNYCFWDGESLRALIAARYPHLLARFQSYAKPVLQADMGRVVVLCEYGGMYVDVDTVCVKRVSSIFHPRADTAYFPPDSIFLRSLLFPNALSAGANNYCFVGPPHHKLWYMLLERMLSDPTAGGSLEYTGPFGKFKDLLEQGKRSGLKIKPLSPQHVISDMHKPTLETFAIHSFDANWKTLSKLYVLRKVPLELYFAAVVAAVALLFSGRKLLHKT